MIGRRAPGVAPGDLLVLRQLAEFPIEWAVVGRDPQDPSRLRVVPADSHPATGSADVRVAAASRAGPLNLRCGHAASLPAGFLAAGLHSGRLEARDLREIARRLEELALGARRGDELGRETDHDPEYQDWIAEVVAPAAEALAAAARAAPSTPPVVQIAPSTPGAPPPAPFRRLPARLLWARAAAAVLALATLGLAWQIVSLRREVERLSRPLFDVPAGEVVLGDETRGPASAPIVLRAGSGGSHLLLTAVLGADLAAGGSGHLEVQDMTGRPVWRSPPFVLVPAAELNLVLPRSLLPGTNFQLALYRAGSSEPVQVRTLEIAAGP